MRDSAKPFYKSKAQEKAWRKSFTAENHAAKRKLLQDLNKLGPEGVARREKAEFLAREAREDRHLAEEARAKFAQAVYAGHTAHDPNARLYEARYRAFVLREALYARVYAGFVALRCAVLGHRFEDASMKDRGYIEKCKRMDCPASKYW